MQQPITATGRALTSGWLARNLRYASASPHPWRELGRAPRADPDDGEYDVVVST
jgi:hypothetical protein